MRYIISFFILCGNYYTLSYGRFIKKQKNNRLGAFGAYLAAVVSSIISIIFLFLR